MEDVDSYPGSRRRISSPRKSSSHKHKEPKLPRNAFPVHIQVDRALHLPSIVDQARYCSFSIVCYIKTVNAVPLPPWQKWLCASQRLGTATVAAKK